LRYTCQTGVEIQNPILRTRSLVKKEGLSISRWVRATLTQLGVDTTNLDITLSGGSVQLRGEIKRLKTSEFDSDQTHRRLLEQITERLRSHKAIKRVKIIS